MTRNSLRRLGTAFALAAALSAPALAQTAKAPSPEHLALARAVIDFTGAGKAFDSVLPALLNDARSMLLTTNPALKNDLDASIEVVRAQLRTREEELLKEISSLYAAKFSQQELKEIAAFYQSPTGQKLTSAGNDILRESYQKAQDWAQRLSSDVMTKLRDEMKKKGHDI